MVLSPESTLLLRGLVGSGVRQELTPASTEILKTDGCKQIVDWINEAVHVRKRLKINDGQQQVMADFDAMRDFAEGELGLELYRLLWNERKWADFDDSSMLHWGASILQANGLLPTGHTWLVWHKAYTHTVATPADLISLAAILVPSLDVDELANTLSEVSNHTGIPMPGMTASLEFWQAMGSENNDAEVWSDAEKLRVQILHNSAEYEDIVNAKSAVWKKVLLWTPQSALIQLMGEGLDEHLKSQSEEIGNIEEFEKLGDTEGILASLPATPLTMRPIISKFKATAVDPEAFEGVHPKLIQSMAASIAYSRPEVKEKIKVFLLGGNGIGHSAVLLKVRNGLVLFDFGLSVVNSTVARHHPLISKVDAVLLSHAHLDHCGGLPLLSQLGRDVPILARKETQLLSRTLMEDTVRILRKKIDRKILETNPTLDGLSNSANTTYVLNNFADLPVDKPIKVLPGMEITARRAGHLFGSTGFEIDVAGKRLFYTGDFNQDTGRLLPEAKFPTDCDVMIFDGTYYRRYDEKEKREGKLRKIIESHERVIIPAFSLGRTQEMLMALRDMKIDKERTIVLTGMGGRLTRDLGIYGGRGRSKKGVRIVGMLNEAEFGEGTVVIAGQGMGQAGPSRALLDFSANDPETAVIFCGYQAPGTLGFHWLQGNSAICKKYKQSVARVKFSGHTNGANLDKFIDSQSGKKIMVHTPKDTLSRLNENDEVRMPSQIDWQLKL